MDPDPRPSPAPAGGGDPPPAPTAWPRERALALTALLLYALLLAPVYGDGENRYHALMDSVYARGTIDVNGSRFPTGDVAYEGGRVYAAAAPGLAFVGLVAYAPVRLVASPLLGADLGELVAYLAAILLASVAPAALGVWAYAGLARDLGEGRRWEALLVYAVGTPLLPYASRLMNHAFVIGALTLAWWAGARALGSPRRGAWAAASGAAAGLAVAADYPAFVACAALGLLQLSRREGLAARALAYAGGALVPGSLLALYHQVAFGSPLRTAYHVWWQQQAAQGVLQPGTVGYSLFTWPVLGELTVGGRVGLFVYCPAALLGLVGAGLALRDRRLRAEAALALGVFAVYLGLNASRPIDYHAADGHGPRYLFVSLPFALRFLPLGLARLGRGAWAALAVGSFGAAWLGVQSVTHVWPDGATIGTRLLDVARAGPRLCWLYVVSRSYGTPPPGLTGLLSAGVLLAAAGAGWAWWRRRDATVAWLCVALGAVTLAHLAV